MARQTKNEEVKEEKPKEYVFYHPNKYLTVATLGVQFKDNHYTTTDIELARKLINVEDIRLISQ